MKTHLLAASLLLSSSVAAQNTLIPIAGHRGHVFDDSRQLLYISTSAGKIERYDVARRFFLPAFVVGTSLNGLDITPDGNYAYVAEELTSGGLGFFYKVDLNDGTVTALPYALATGERGGWDVCIANNGKGLLSTRYASSGWVPLREVDLATDVLTIRTDAPGSLGGGQVRQDTHINRGSDRSLLFLTESRLFSGPTFTYLAASNSFGSQRNTGGVHSATISSVDAGGSLIALEVPSVSLLDSGLNTIGTLSSLNMSGGLVFDGVRSTLYAVDATTDDLLAFQAPSLFPLFSLDVQEDVGNSTPLGSGEMSASADGRYVFLSTPSGIRQFDLGPVLTTDVGVGSIDTPASAASLGSEVVSVTLVNYGSAPQTGFDVTYLFGGLDVVTETFTDTLPAYGIKTFTFATPANLSIPGTYTLEVFTELSGDENPANDSASSIIVHQGVVTSFPHFEDFETDQGMLIAGGSASTWEWGEPEGTVIDHAASGARAWVTNLDGPYASPGSSYLQSPRFDFSGLSNDPFLQFAHVYQMNLNDASWVEISIDGAPYEKLGAAGDPGSLNWYNDAFYEWWDGATTPVGAWRTARHIVPGAAGHVVTFRWRFEAVNPPLIFSEGIGIDDLAIFEAPFGKGQRPQLGTAQLDINNSLEVVGFPVISGEPGPYFTAVSASSETVDFHVVGQPFTPIILIGGTLHVGAAHLAAGQLDVSPFQVYASGLQTSGLNPFFVTNLNGTMDLSLSVPVGLVGQVVSFQAGLVTGAPTETFALSNAVQVTFLP